MNLKIFKNNILTNISYIFKLEKNLGKPFIRALEPTNSCMMDCIMCPRKSMKRKVEFMKMDLFKKIIDQAKWNESIWLHFFGESLLHPKICEMIKYSNDKGIKARLSVNPKLLSEKMAEKLIDAGLNDLHISLDAMDDKTYKDLRGKNANYDEAVKNINTMLMVKNKKKSKMIIELSFIRMKINKNLAENFRKMWGNKKGLDFVKIKNFTTWDSSDESIINLGDEDTYSDMFKGLKIRNYCSEPWLAVSITADGKVVPCCFDCHQKYVLGDLNTESLEKIWNNERMMLLRRQIKNKKFNENNLCKSCKEHMELSVLRLRPKHIITVPRRLFKKIFKIKPKHVEQI
jgi:radical SAM protein with 4Fe4S-binding SPASM domain